MSITTERPAFFDPRTVAESRAGVRTPQRRSAGTGRGTAARRRATIERRRYVHATAPQTLGAAADDGCAHEDNQVQAVSWTTMIAGAVATAVVILGFVAVANLRAGSLDSAPQPAVSTVQQGQSISDVARVGQ